MRNRRIEKISSLDASRIVKKYYRNKYFIVFLISFSIGLLGFYFLYSLYLFPVIIANIFIYLSLNSLNEELYDAVKAEVFSENLDFDKYVEIYTLLAKRQKKYVKELYCAKMNRAFYRGNFDEVMSLDSNVKVSKSGVFKSKNMFLIRYYSILVSTNIFLGDENAYLDSLNKLSKVPGYSKSVRDSRDLQLSLALILAEIVLYGKYSSGFKKAKFGSKIALLFYGYYVAYLNENIISNHQKADLYLMQLLNEDSDLFFVKIAEDKFRR